MSSKGSGTRKRMPNRTPTCATCGSALGAEEHDRAECHACRSPKGKIAELDVAIRASGGSTDRIAEWPVIRHLLRQRFGDRPEAELWERCTDWLRAEGGMMPEEYLSRPLAYLCGVLEHGFLSKPKSVKTANGTASGPLTVFRVRG